MATIRVSLCSMGYPKIAPNCLITLQSLVMNGYKIILKDVFYKDRDAIVDYFNHLGLSMEFSSVRDPEIDILRNTFRVFSEWHSLNSWKDIDQVCLSEGVYTRNSRYSFIPSYRPNTFFLVLNYGEKTQVVDSSAVSLSSIKQRAQNLFNFGKANNVTIVDANTLRITGVVDKNGYTEFEEVIYFNNEL